MCRPKRGNVHFGPPLNDMKKTTSNSSTSIAVKHFQTNTSTLTDSSLPPRWLPCTLLPADKSDPTSYVLSSLPRTLSTSRSARAPATTRLLSMMPYTLPKSCDISIEERPHLLTHFAPIAARHAHPWSHFQRCRTCHARRRDLKEAGPTDQRDEQGGGELYQVCLSKVFVLESTSVKRQPGLGWGIGWNKEGRTLDKADDCTRCRNRS